jgi:hypothetical protein
MTTATVETKTLDEKFQEYHEDNSHVYQALVRLARGLKDQGYKRVGIKMLWETMRYRLMIETDDLDGFKLNNNYPSRYARMMMDNEPELQGFFEIRELKS